MEEEKTTPEAPFLRILIVEDTPERQAILKNLYKDHAWILVNTARRAIRMVKSYAFDIISLDYNLATGESGDDVAKIIATSQNKDTKVIVHSMNKQGADRIKAYLPDVDIVPISKMIKSNKVFKKIRQQLSAGINIDWATVFRR